MKFKPGSSVNFWQIPKQCEPLSKLLVPPISPIVVPYITPYITPSKEFRLWLMWYFTGCLQQVRTLNPEPGRSCQTSPLRIGLGRTKAVLNADGSDGSTFCLKRQKNELQADSRSDGYPGPESAVRETSDARKSKTIEQGARPNGEQGHEKVELTTARRPHNET